MHGPSHANFAPPVNVQKSENILKFYFDLKILVFLSVAIGLRHQYNINNIIQTSGGSHLPRH